MGIRKNIVVLITDTFRYDNIGDRAERPVRTPELDRFAAERATEVEPGIAVPRHSAVELALCGANRNQPALDQPENWAPAEGRGTGATFGFGRHVCLGKTLALAELREVAVLLRKTGFQASSIRERSPMGTSTFRRPAAIRLALGPDSR